MLTGRARRGLAVAAALVGVAVGSTTSALSAAGAEPPPGITCPEGMIWDGAYCSIVLSDSDSASGGSVEEPLRDDRCTRTTAEGRVEVPCTGEGGWWSETRECYMLYTPDPSDPSVPLGEENGVTGGVYECLNPFTGFGYTIWVPMSEVPTFVDPARMAVQLVASMRFDPIRIGSAPEARPGAVGLIGLPTWLWVVDPSATTWGPNEKSVTLSGITVTAVGRVDRVVWTMGDGGSVTCEGPGTPYADRFGAEDSPNCGYRYRRPGQFSVTATAYWTVDWTASTGESGSVPLSIGSRGVLVIGEAQVINR